MSVDVLHPARAYQLVAVAVIDPPPLLLEVVVFSDGCTTVKRTLSVDERQPLVEVKLAEQWLLM